LSFIDSTQLYQPLIFLFPNAYYHALIYIGSIKVTPRDAECLNTLIDSILDSLSGLKKVFESFIVIEINTRYFKYYKLFKNDA